MNSVERFFAKLTFSGQKKLRILRQIQRLIKSDVQITAALDQLWHLYSKKGKKPKEPMAQMIAEWRTRLNQGKSLAQSMSGWVSTSEELIIQAGEQSEKLAVALEDAVQSQNAARAIRNAIIGGLIYPGFLVFALIGILWGFSTEIVPTFATILPPEQWTGNAANMYALSQFIVAWFPMIGMIAGATISAVLISLPILGGPVRRYLDYLPPWSIYKVTQGASFMISMRGFVAAGATIQDALRNMLKLGNPYFKERVAAIYSRINMGRNLGEAMLEAGYNFPDDEIAGEVSIYSELDDFEGSLDLLSKEWINGSVTKTQATMKLINTLMMVAVAISIGMIMVTMFQLQEAATAAAG